VEVGVARDGAGQLAVTSTPALVPGPPDAEVPTLTAPAWRAPANGDPVAEAVARFTEALLTGAGDVSRYLGPGVELRTIDDPPFVSTSLVRLAVEHLHQGQLLARALIEGRTASGSMAFVAYELRMEERAGRWEVVAISGAPALGARRAPADRTTTTTAPATPGA
jgi:GNAT superfamily N-acetyltransferase